MSEPTLTDEQREALYAPLWAEGCHGFMGDHPGLEAVVAAMLAGERAAREAAEAKVRDLTAGIGELADEWQRTILTGYCGDGCDYLARGNRDRFADDLRALVDDPAAALAEVRAEAWDEGYEAGRDDESFVQRGLSTDPDADEHPHSNPYRAEAEGAGR